MIKMLYPGIDLKATGENILRLRKEHGYSVTDLQEFFGFTAPQAIYKWQNGQSLPSTDNLYALCKLLNTPMEEILVPLTRETSPGILHYEDPKPVTREKNEKDPRDKPRGVFVSFLNCDTLLLKQNRTEAVRNQSIHVLRPYHIRSG